jgi:penicillin amidase
MDWEGILPFEKWPQAVDPAHGFFANWNNKPAKDWEPSPYGRLFWGKKIIDVLATNEKVTFEQVQGLARQTAYHDFLADYFTDHIVGPSRDSKNEVVAKALALLAAYDREKRAGRPEPVIVEKWVQAMFKRIFGDEFGILLAERNLQRMLVDPLLYMLDGNGVIKSDFASGADLKDLSREALNEVLKDGIDKLAWKDETADFGPKLGKVAGQKGRGTFQMAVELAPDGPRAMTLAAPGASELLDSPHYGDQIELFKEWKYKPFVFRRDGMK